MPPAPSSAERRAIYHVSEPGARGGRLFTAEHNLGGMLALIIIALVIGALLGVLGFVVKGLLWLAIIGILLFVAAAIFGAVRRAASR